MFTVKMSLFSSETSLNETNENLFQDYRGHIVPETVPFSSQPGRDKCGKHNRLLMKIVPFFCFNFSTPKNGTIFRLSALLSPPFQIPGRAAKSIIKDQPIRSQPMRICDIIAQMQRNVKKKNDD